MAPPRTLVQLILPALFSALLASCAVNPVSGNRDFVLMSEEEEIALGRKFHPQVMKEYATYDHDALQAYVQEVGQRLAATSHRPDLIFRFTLLDSTQVNAFALPGGYIYITRGLLAYLNSEAELAAVLGHEIGHVTARHSVRQHSAATTASLVAAVIGAASGVQGAGDLANVAGDALVRGYGREHELESDRLGAEYLARAGYDPRAMLEVIGVLKDQETFEIQLAREEGREPRVYHGLFSTHPSNDRRLQETVLAAQQYETGTRRSLRRELFLKQLDGLVFGHSEQEGVLRGNTFYHRPMDFGVTFPDGWRVENHPDKLLARSPDGAGHLAVQVQDLNRRISPRDFMIKRLDLTKLRAGEPLKVGKREGYTGLHSINTDKGRRIMRVAVLYHGDQAFIFHGYYDDRRNPGDDHAVLTTARTFHSLSATERKLARPQRIRLTRAEPGTTMAKLARKSPIQHHAEDQLRLLNDIYPDGQPRTGSWLKIVR